MKLADSIDACLPQTQCGQCGYPRCRDYAEAVAAGDADIDQCPPGDVYTIAALARLTNVGVKPLNPDFGVHRAKEIARIDEQACIGCVLCIKACPVDAILGAAKLMHTVIENECTGCELCLPACPTDCIDMRRPTAETHGQSPWPGFSLQQVNKARRRSEQKLRRLAAREEARRQRRHRLRKAQMQREIQAAVARVRASRSGSG